MSFVVYILQSTVNSRKYIGSTQDLSLRLERHNNGDVRSTKPYRPYVVIYKELFKTRVEALKREKQLKSYKGGRALQKLLNQQAGRSQV